VWYKLSDRTGYGAGLAIFGALITLGLNYAFIPAYGYMASAWATFACYGSMMVASYLLGRKFYPVPYEVGKLVAFIGGAVLLYYTSVVLHVAQMPYGMAINGVFLLGYAALSWVLLRSNFK
jgi:O-antigen/teichoic acid export membrane protein